jgi:PAS domain S-box-containing protein
MNNPSEHRHIMTDAHLSYDFLYSVFNAMDEAIKFVDSNGFVFFANREAAKLVNKSVTEILGLKCDDPIFSSESSFMSESLAKIKKNERNSNNQFQIKLNGEKRIYESSMVPVYSDKLDAIIIISKDITSKKQLESEINQREKLASIGQLASSLAHEIRNPLTGIRLGLNVLKPKIVGEDMEVFDGISSDIKRLEDILHSLLDYSKVREKKKSEVDVNKLINESLILLRKQAESENVRIETEFSDILPRALIDPNEIKQVIINILLNSIQSIEGAGLITIKTSNYTLNNRFGLLILVEDSGVGIERNILSKINDLFFTTKKDGTGLGLPMSQKIIREHGGSIVFNSEPGIGTITRIFLPIEP